MIPFKEKFFLYLNKRTFGSLLVDDISGSGKSSITESLLSNKSSDFESNLVKYYCYIDINKICNLDLKQYIIENSKVIHTDLDANLYYELSWLKNNFIFGKLYLSFRNIIEKIPIIKKLFYPLITIINLILSWIAKTNVKINNSIDSNKEWKSYLYREIKIDDSIVIVIDDIEKRNATTHLNDVFSSLQRFYDKNNVKIIVIANSVLLKNNDYSIFNTWKSSHTQFVISFDYEYDDYDNENNFFLLQEKTKKFEYLSLVMKEDVMNFLIDNNIKLKNINILNKIDKFLSELITIENEIIFEYNSVIETKKIKEEINNDFSKLRSSLVIMCFMYLGNFDLKKEKEEYEEYGDYETIDKYFKGDHNNLKERLESVVTFYTIEFNYIEKFYLLYLKENPEVRHKIMSNKPIIYEYERSRKIHIYELFSDEVYYPSTTIIDFVMDLVNNPIFNLSDSTTHFQFLDIMEKIYEIKRIEFIWEWNDFIRIAEDVDFYYAMIKKIEIEFLEFKRIIIILNKLRKDIFVRQLQNKFISNFTSFRNAININFFDKFSIYDSFEVFDYITNVLQRDILYEIIDSCIYHDVDLIVGVNKFIDRNPNNIYKTIKIIENFRYGYLSDEVKKLKQDLNNRKKTPILGCLDYEKILEEKKDRMTLLNINGNLCRIYYDPK